VACGLAEEKFRRVRLSNSKIKACLVDVPGAIDALVAIGWATEGGEEDPALVVPKGRHISMAEVRATSLEKANTSWTKSAPGAFLQKGLSSEQGQGSEMLGNAGAHGGGSQGEAEEKAKGCSQEQDV
jgi:hypothetical protein